MNRLNDQKPALEPRDMIAQLGNGKIRNICKTGVMPHSLGGTIVLLPGGKSSGLWVAGSREALRGLADQINAFLDRE